MATGLAVLMINALVITELMVIRLGLSQIVLEEPAQSMLHG